MRSFIKPLGRFLVLMSGLVLVNAECFGQVRVSRSFSDTDVYCVSYSPDGKSLAAGRRDGKIVLLDSNNGATRSILTSCDDDASSLAFSPDGKSLAVGCGDGFVRLWDLSAKIGKPKVVRKVRGGFLAFSPDGQTLASIDQDVVRLWSMPRGKPKGILKPRLGPIRGVTFSPDNKTLACCGAVPKGPTGAWATLWDWSRGQVKATLKGHRGTWVIGIAFSPDGKLLATAGSDHSVKLWDVGTTKEKSTMTGHTDIVNAVAFHPDGSIIASASRDKSIRLWDIHTHKVRAVLRGHKAGVYSVAFSPDGKSLVSVSGNSGAFGELLIWDIRLGKQEKQKLRAGSPP
jgi:WD40 repeat protein